MSNEKAKPITVSAYISLLNNRLADLYGEITGEICEMTISAKGHVYIVLKDKDMGDILPCTIWRRSYELSGVELEVGTEVIIRGSPNFFGPFGKLSFNVKAFELVGAGALKKAYEKLKKKLTAEGLFDVERKRALPLFPKKIGVITSIHGAVIHDFNNNLRKAGFCVKVLDARVEGPESGRALALSVRALKKEDLDVLVLIRGGGSMQSLSGFDNEALVREIVNFPVPVVTGIGHHQDVPLAALAADASESTPSLVAALLGKSWDRAIYSLEKDKGRILDSYRLALEDASSLILSSFKRAEQFLGSILEKYEEVVGKIRRGAAEIDSKIRRIEEGLQAHIVNIKNKYIVGLRHALAQIESLSRLIEVNNPERQIRLGYSIAFLGNKVVKSIKDVKIGETLNLRVSDGEISSNIKKLK